MNPKESLKAKAQFLLLVSMLPVMFLTICFFSGYEPDTSRPQLAILISVVGTLMSVVGLYGAMKNITKAYALPD